MTTLNWLNNQTTHRTILLTMNQPLTAHQIARRTGLDPRKCMASLRKLAKRNLVRCLNPGAPASRLYVPTSTGQTCRKQLDGAVSESQHATSAQLDWNLYGWLLYRHRSAILKALTSPMQPPDVKRAAKARDPTLRLSVDHCREALYDFVKKGIARTVPTKIERFKCYALTELGQRFRELLLGAEVRA